MRQFVCIGHDAPTTPDFSLDDIAGGAGRLDVLCRCVTSALLVSHGVREEVRVHLVLGDEFDVAFDGATVRRLNPDERSTAALVRTALENRKDAVGALPAEPSPGVELYRRGIEGTLEVVSDGATIVQLHEEGESITTVDPPENPAFVLSDHRDVTDAEAALLEGVADRRVRLGPERLHADDAITVAHHYLDTDGYDSF